MVRQSAKARGAKGGVKESDDADTQAEATSPAGVRERRPRAAAPQFLLLDDVQAIDDSDEDDSGPSSDGSGRRRRGRGQPSSGRRGRPRGQPAANCSRRKVRAEARLGA